MFDRTIVALCAGLAMAGCVETADMSGGAEMSDATDITTEAAFRAAVVGKTLTFMDNTLVVNSNGTISGPWDGSGITGTWEWRGGFWCRVVTIGDGPTRPEDCQKWSISGNVATVSRDRGNGASFDYIIS